MSSVKWGREGKSFTDTGRWRRKRVANIISDVKTNTAQSYAKGVCGDDPLASAQCIMGGGVQRAVRRRRLGKPCSKE